MRATTVDSRILTLSERRSHRSAGSRRLALVPAPGVDRYRGLFENSPISLWEEDFSELKLHLDRLRQTGVTDLRAYLEQHPEELQRCAGKVRVVDVNEATLELLECDDKAKLIGRLPVIFRDASYDVFLDEIVALAAGEPVFERDVVNRTFKGNRIDVRVRLTLAPGHESTWAKVFISLTDITEWKRAQAQLELHHVAMESAADGIFIARRDGRIEWANRAFARMTGYTRREIVGRTPSLLQTDPDDDYYERLWTNLDTDQAWRNRTVNRHKAGTLYTVEETITPIAGADGEITHFVAVQQDISDRLESEEKLIRLARTDFLTGLPNRYTFNERLQREAERAARRNLSVAVLLIDIDNFKDVNDLFGHPVGDSFLVAVAERLRGSLRSLDTVARLGGDEFAVLQTDADQPETTASVAGRLLSVLAQPFHVEGYKIHTSASMGIAQGRADRVDPKQMIRQADLALYRAKQGGRGTFRFHEEEMDEQIQERLRLGQALRDSIRLDQLSLVFQPQVDLPTGRTRGVEALVRWDHPELGAVPPGRFIPIAENNGFILPLGEWVLRTACEAYPALAAAGGDELTLAVNVSAVQMRSAGFAGKVLRLLDETGLPPHRLELELTEGVLMQQSPRTERTLAQLREAGVRLALDDFGTGYSSMAYLRRFSVDKLKIDRSFVENLESNPSDTAIVSAAIALGTTLGIEVLAEGVEHPDQADFLRANGCDAAQGYLFGRPATADEVARGLGGKAATPLSPPAEPHSAS